MCAKRFCRVITGIADAQAWANKLLQPLQQLGEARGPGDMENAMRHEREITKAKVQDFEALGSATAEPPRRESDLT